MIGWLRVVVVTVLFALLGAAAGRLLAEQPRRAETGEAGPSSLEVALELPKPQELVPGLVAALRVGDRPWSFLHIPPWAAAFAVNLVVAAMGRELQPLAGGLSREGSGFGFDGSPAAHPRAPDAPSVEVETVVVDGHAEGRSNGPAGAARPVEGFVPFED